MPLVDEVAVHLRVEAAVQAGGLENLAAVLAGGDDREPQAGFPGGLQVADRAFIPANAVAIDDLREDFVLARRDLLDQVGRGVDVPGREERAHSVDPRPAVDVGVVVGVRVKGNPALLENLLPGPSMLFRGSGQHAVQIEQTGGHGCGQAEARPGHGGLACHL